MLNKKEIIDLIDRRIEMYKEISIELNHEGAKDFYNGASVSLESLRKDIAEINDGEDK